ncbi:MAG: hypothetical protein ACFHVJ_17580 [Aestuariibacter sp.]
MVKQLAIFLTGCLCGFILSTLYAPDSSPEPTPQPFAQSEYNTDSNADKSNSTKKATSDVATTEKAASTDEEQQHAQLLNSMQSEIAKLQARNEALRTSLSQEQQSSSEHDTAAQDIPVMSEKEAQQHLSNQLQQYIPQPYLKLTHDMAPVAQMQILKLHQADQDYDWGYEMEIKVRDLFVTQFNQAQFQLASVTCKWSQCEILVRLLQDVPSHDIFQTLSAQPWWRFGSTNSRTANGEQTGELLMYLFASGWRQES